jgi:hypothetical protein
MQAFVIDPASPSSTANLTGAIVTHEVKVPGGGRIRKGQVLAAEDLDLIARLDAPIHAIRLEPGEIHEDEAATRLARLAIGPGLMARKPVQSRVNIVAECKGLLRVDPAAVELVNNHAPLGLFTVLDRLPVVPGKIVAGAKIGTVAMPESTLASVESLIAAREQPILEVKPYLPHRVGVVVTEGLAEKLRDRFETSVSAKVRWYGSEIVGFVYVANDTSSVQQTIERFQAEGANMIFTAGGNMMDPLDASLQAMPEIGANIIRLGAPAHPGSMFWLAEVEESGTPIVNLASCSMYSKATVADLVMPWLMSGETVSERDMASIGYGGLLDRDMGWRFPTYDVETVDEPDES